MPAMLEVRGLTTQFAGPRGFVTVVDKVGFVLEEGATLAIVGESGCGKSVTAMSVLRVLPEPPARIAAGEVLFAGRDLLRLGEDEMRKVRGRDISMIFQEPMTSLNPSWSIGNQLEEGWLRHRGGPAAVARERALHLLERVGITGAASRLGQYPHQLSGGLRQRVMIAMALMCEPALMIADEPTTALDVTVQAQILHLLKELQRELGMGLILITHDLGIVARVADRVAVMYAGEIVEEGPVKRLFGRPTHPYTRGLLECIPVPGRLAPGERLGTIPGVVSPPIGALQGCQFRNRCEQAEAICAVSDFELRELGDGQRLRCRLGEAT